VVTAVSLAGAARALAQQGGADVIRRGRTHGGARPPAGFYRFVATHPGAFEFKHGWLARARQVRLNRQALRAAGAWRQLNQRMALSAPSASATAVSGTLRYPTFLPLFSNTSAADSTVMDPPAVAAEFWGTAPAPPYSITTYYQEISGGLLTVTGTVIPPIRVSRSDTAYAGGVGCYGLCGTAGVPDLIEELLDSSDATVDFAQYADSTTGYVPAIVILDPQIGGECNQVAPASTSIWAHRFSLTGWGYPAYQTRDSLNGKPVYVDDYIIQGGEGGGQGSSFPGCTWGALAPIGTVTHETGHLFGLPDLYDVSDQTEGIGRWDLMSEGNEQTPWRPSHMSAWSLATMGWITETPLTTTQTDTAPPIETGRVAYLVPLASAPTEFFLLENRQPLGSDSMMYGPGLMIYHLDTLLMAQRGFSNGNYVNAVVPHALAVEEAAGDTGLDCTWPAACNDRGDAGDPFPGTGGNTAFGPGTKPAARTDAGAPAGIRIDSIRQLAPSGAMSFRLTVGGITTVAASDTAATVLVDGVRAAVFRDLFADGSSHTIAIDSAQASVNGKVQYVFSSWSDGQARQHTVTGVAAGRAYTAQVYHRYLFRITVLGAGSVTATRTIEPSVGSFVTEGDSVTLTPVPAAGSAFVGWSVDTVTGAQVLALKASHPYSLVATFAGTTDVVHQLLTGRSSLTAGQLLVLDGLGNNNGRFDLGDFVAWLDRNPGVLTAQAAALLARVRR